jgi:glycosyltransferase involved in cell wall biosynthesis
MVLAVSKSVLDYYVSPGTPSLVIHNSAPARFASHEVAEVMRSPDDPIVVMQGKVGSHRGHGVVLEAARLASAKLKRPVRVIVFEDPMESPSELAEVRRLAQRFDAEDYLDLRPPISYADMPALLRTCDIGLLTYSRVFGINGLPNRLFEYMAVGLPIIGPSYGREVASIVRNAECGILVDCEDAHEISNAIVRLSEDAKQARRIGANGRTAFETQYAWEREVAPFLHWIASRTYRS